MLARCLGQRLELLVSVRSVLHLGLHLQRGAADVLHPRRDVLEGTPCVRLPGTEFLTSAPNSLSWISGRAHRAAWSVGANQQHLYSSRAGGCGNDGANFGGVLREVWKVRVLVINLCERGPRAVRAAALQVQMCGGQ